MLNRRYLFYGVFILIYSCIGEIQPLPIKTKSEVLQNLTPSETKGFYNIDAFNHQQLKSDRPNPLEEFTLITGWAVEPIEQNTTKELWVAIDTFMFQVYDRDKSRPDVAAHFGKPSYENTGFSVMIYTKGLEVSEANLSLITVDRATNTYYPQNQTVRIKLVN